MRGRVAAAVLAVTLIAVASAPSGSAAAATPDLALAISMDLAGGGPDRFSTMKLVGALFGTRSKAEIGKIRSRFGAGEATLFFTVGDYAVPRAMELVQDANMTIPDNPSPQPSDTRALAAALYRAGATAAGRFDADRFFSTVLSPSIYGHLRQDITAKFPGGMAEFRTVLTAMMADLQNLDRSSRPAQER